MIMGRSFAWRLACVWRLQTGLACRPIGAERFDEAPLALSDVDGVSPRVLAGLELALLRYSINGCNSNLMQPSLAGRGEGRRFDSHHQTMAEGRIHGVLGADIANGIVWRRSPPGCVGRCAN
jgi:hypothetical protein